jgi:hypothetical protein
MRSADDEAQAPKDCLGCKITGSSVFAALSAYALLEARRGSRRVSPESPYTKRRRAIPGGDR